jgi:ABC-type transport system involved in multi-copper enzyme maturation permease subunit
MNRSIRAEMVKLRRPIIVFGGGGAFVLFGVLATMLTFVTAKAAPARFSVATAPATRLDQLAGAEGLTRGFAIAAGFLGLLVFVLFLTSVAAEYGQGTIRALLVRQPGRARLLGGKLVALIACVAAALLAAEAASLVTAIAFAHIRGVSTAAWPTTTGLRHVWEAYANALLAAACYGILGAGLAVLTRSTAVALGVGIAYLGPIEHITQLTWTDAEKWLPGLLIDSLAVGGTPLVSFGRALLATVGIAVVAFVIGAVSFLRRDVTA